MAQKDSRGTNDWRKVPIRMTKIPSRITNTSLASGLEEMLGTKGFLPQDAIRLLKKEGFGGTLESPFNVYVTKEQFLRVVKSLEDTGLLKHKPGYAHDIYNKLGSWEAWQKFRSRNLERRKKEYMKEDRTASRVLEQAAFEKRVEERLSRLRPEGGRAPFGRAVSFSEAERGELVKRGKLTTKGKRNLLFKAKSSTKEVKGIKSSWVGTGGSGWSGGKDGGWRKEK